MNFKFTVAKKLILGFGIVTIAILVNIFLIDKTLKKSIEVNENISTIYVPSADLIQQLSDMIVTSKMLIKNWVYIEKQPDTPDKKRLVELQRTELPTIHDKILKIYDTWTPEEQKEYEKIYVTIKDTLFSMHQDVMNKLSTMESYDDFFLLMTDIYI